MTVRSPQWFVLLVALTGARPALADGAGAASSEAGTASNAPPASENPHAGAGNPHAGGPDAEPHDDPFRPPEDGVFPSEELPAGSIEALLVTPSGAPIPNQQATLSMLYNTVAKGESTKRTTATSDANGRIRFDHLETGSGVAYRVSVLKDGGTFAVPPFRLPESSGFKALLHVYPVAEDLSSVKVALPDGRSVMGVASEGAAVVEVKDDRVQIQQFFWVYNFSRTAWVPKDWIIPLPETFTGFAPSQDMGGLTAAAVAKKGIRVTGTIAPGRHRLEYSWQIPYDGTPNVDVVLGVTPNLAQEKIICPAGKNVHLSAEGFPAPVPTKGDNGQRALITQRQFQRDEPPVRELRMTISGLPTEGPGRWIATVLAALGVVVGVVYGSRKQAPSGAPTHQRDELLGELAELERAYRSEVIGPKTYEASRRQLMDALARTFAPRPT